MAVSWCQGRVEGLAGGTALKMPVSPLGSWWPDPSAAPWRETPSQSSPLSHTALILCLVTTYTDKWDRKERVRDPQMLELADIEFKIN